MDNENAYTHAQWNITQMQDIMNVKLAGKREARINHSELGNAESERQAPHILCHVWMSALNLV